MVVNWLQNVVIRWSNTIISEKGCRANDLPEQLPCMSVVITIVCHPIVLMTLGCDYKNFSNLSKRKKGNFTHILISINFPENTSHFGYLWEEQYLRTHRRSKQLLLNPASRWQHKTVSGTLGLRVRYAKLFAQWGDRGQHCTYVFFKLKFFLFIDLSAPPQWWWRASWHFFYSRDKLFCVMCLLPEIRSPTTHSWHAHLSSPLSETPADKHHQLLFSDHPCLIWAAISLNSGHIIRCKWA